MASIIDPPQRRDAQGRYLPGSSYRSQTRDQRLRTAREWKAFRRNFLFSQNNLATALGISRRTVTNVEAGECIPSLKAQRAFRDLKRQQEREAAA